METLVIVFAALLADNLMLTHLFGIESFFTSSERASGAAAYGGMVTAVTVISGAVSLALYNFIFIPLKMKFMATFVSVLVTVAVICLMNFLLRKYAGGAGLKFTANIPMITTNCVILGSVMLCIEKSLSYGVSLLYLLFAGLGFTLAVLVFSSVRERLVMSEPPAAFRGLPILLLSAAFAAMAFSGFWGLSF